MTFCIRSTVAMGPMPPMMPMVFIIYLRSAAELAAMLNTSVVNIVYKIISQNVKEE
jgi:hypothetical protein